MIGKAVIPAAGLGTRLLSATKEQPKEMLPLFAADGQGVLCLKPVVERVFEQIFDFGVREFYFIVGKRKRAIEDHFTPDREFIDQLNGWGKTCQAQQLEGFYRRIEASTIVWVNQPDPRGFGNAVLQAKRMIGEESFLVHAGDTYLASSVSKPYNILERLSRAHQKNRAEAILALKEIHDPRQYGVAEVLEKGEKDLEVRRLVEKPLHPTSKLAIMPVYIFEPKIFGALSNTERDRQGEIQLTDAIQKLVDTRHTVQAIKLGADDIYLDVGTVETYWEALKMSHDHALFKTVH